VNKQTLRTGAFGSAMLAAIILSATFFPSSVSAASADTTDIKVVKAETVGMASERLKRIGVGMRRLIDADKIPGTVTLVSRRGKVVHFEANGMRDVGKSLPMEKDTIFRLYSQTKPVTGAAVMMLFEEGHFLLSDPVSKYLPEFRDMVVYVGSKDGKIQTEPARPITIHHLLTHTSGLTYSLFPTPVGQIYSDAAIDGSVAPLLQIDPQTGKNFLLDAEDDPERHGTLKEWSERVAQLPLVAQPGTEWNYSVSMDVLGRLVEVISGQTYRDFLKSRLFEPLGMSDTDFYVPEEKLSRFATNYAPNPQGGMIAIDEPANSYFRSPPTIAFGGSGLVGTVGDYLKFAQMLANKGEYEGRRYLGTKTVEFMMEDHLPATFPDDPTSNLRKVIELYGAPHQGRAWGVGFGVAGSVVTNPAISGLPVSKGTFSWGGAATTHFWVDHEEELVGLVHTQLFPDGTHPVSQLMQLLTYQAIID